MKEEEEINDQIFLKSDNKNNDNEIYTKKNNKKIILIILIVLILITISLIIILLINKDEDENPTPKNQNVYIEPSSGVHTHTIIFMPGMTNTPEDFLSVLTQRISISRRNTTKIVILRSPLQNVTVLKGENYSWFDIYSFPMNSSNTYNFSEIKAASKTLAEIIKEEVALLDGKYDKIIIGGHSQGAIISMYTSYTQEYMLGGVVSFSGFFPPQGEILPNKEKLNVYFAFGDKDNIISPEFFNETIKDIKDNEGFKLYIYPNHAHSVCNNEIIDVGYFLDKIME